MAGKSSTIITFEATPYYDKNIYVDHTSIPGLTGIQEEEISGTLPCEFYMYQNFPNPFNPTTKIKIALPVSGDVAMSIYDVLGREVTRLLTGSHNAGRYLVTWDASSFGSGIYFARLVFKAESDYKTRTKNIKLLLAK
jgi:Secretion system C-terminal sorting domain